MSLLWVKAATHQPQFGEPGVMTWDEVQEKHPYYDVRPASHPHPNYPDEYHGPNEDHGWAVEELAHGESGDTFDGAMGGGEHDLPYTEEMVHPEDVRYERHPPDDDRVRRALHGYRHQADIPPVLLVKRAGEYHVADGHHRLSAANMLNLHVPAIVAHSPRTDRLVY